MSRRYKTTWLTLAMISFVLASVWIGQLTSNRTLAESRSASVTIHDFGSQYVEETNDLLRHTFEITNDDVKLWRIVDIVKSCGCLEVNVPGHSLRPGEVLVLKPDESIRIQLGVQLPGPGLHSETVEVVFADHSTHKLVVKVVGKIRNALDVFVEDTTVQEGRFESRLRLYWRHLGSVEDLPSPTFVAGSNVQSEFSGWSILERFSAEHQRPARYIGTARIRGTIDDNTRSTEITVAVAGTRTQVILRHQ